MAFQYINLDKFVLSDLEYVTNFSHGESPEVYHSLYNKRLPKSTQQATIDSSLGSELSQAEAKSNVSMYYMYFSMYYFNVLNILKGKQQLVSKTH